MKYTSEHYRQLLQALLPIGPAWPREHDAVMTKFILALAEEFARLDARVDDLLNEIDPRTTSELLADWERAFGLPDACTVLATTTVERRQVLHEKVSRIGGATPQYFIDVAARLGFAITITDTGLGAHVWQVNAPLNSIQTFKAGLSRAGEPLRTWGNDLLECVIIRLKPAHTRVLFAYT